MKRSRFIAPVNGAILLFLILLNAIVLQQALVSHSRWYDLLYLTVPLLLICLFLNGSYAQYERKDMNTLLKKFSKEGSKNNLQFSSQELLMNCVMGLDGIHRKLLIVKKAGELFHSVVVDLNEVQSCAAIKQYYLNSDQGRNKNQHYLEKIILSFQLKNRREPVEVVFYQDNSNSVYEMVALARKARHWELILSKLQLPLKRA